MSLEELIKLRKIKHHYYLWKKCFARDDEHVIEWNTQARETSTRKNQNRIESFVEPFTTWFKPTTSEFNGKIISKEYARGQVVSSSTGSNREGIVCEQEDNVENNKEKLNNSEDDSFETTIFVKAKSKGTFNSCFRERKKE